MIKNADYYKDRLMPKSLKLYDEAVGGRSDDEISEDEFMEMYDDLQEIGYPNLLARIGLHFNEAKVIIRKLVDNFDDEDPDKIYDLLWVDRVTELFGKGELMTANSTKAEMIERIQWISNEDFGEDIFEWSDWLEAFEADIPSWGDR